eukprot:s3951_g21.t1
MDVESGPLSSWLCGELPPAIATEMDNSSFDDCISFRISEIGAKLDTLRSNFLQELSAHAERKGFDADGADPFRDFPANGKRPWAAEVGAESSVADIGVLAKETIFVQLPGTKTVEFCDAAGKAGPRPGRFEALFAVKSTLLEFQEKFGGQVKSDSAVAAMTAAQKILDRVNPDLKQAKVFTIEIFLTKALMQHHKAFEQDDKSQMERAVGVMNREVAILSSANVYDVAVHDLNRRVYSLSKQLVQ